MMKIRKAAISDLPSVIQICKKYNFEPSRNWKELFSSRNTEIFLLLENEKIIGLTGLIHNDWNGTLQVLNIFIVPSYRRKGLGAAVIKFLIGKAKKTRYRCLIAEAPSLSHAAALYKKLGFRKCGYNDRYYSNRGREIALWMSFDL